MTSTILLAARRGLAASLLAAACAAVAGPGAHGPNGEHLDAPSGAAAAADSTPRLESFSEAFELVARLHDDALVIDLGRYASNEPVVAATLEVESGAAKAAAAFDAASGSYRVTDAALLAALHGAGKHALMFTIAAGGDADLLEGSLEVAAHEHGDAVHGGLGVASAWPLAASALFVGGVAWFGWRRRSAQRTGGRA
ncbi:hypothetical protein [Caldimonas sp. KR1-144]|uniref:hypothetical protein n=1 Tax=Caldimonas sp. KR1-144 TaxID=3400911 RepID=UPI003C02F6E1